MNKEIPIDERLKKIKDFPFEEILKLAQDVRTNAGLKSNTPEGWQVFSFITNIGLMLKLDIKLRRLNSKIKSLNEQSQKLEKTNISLQRTTLSLSFIAIFFTLLQTLQTVFNLIPICNILISISLTILIGIILSSWIKKND